MTRIQLKEVTKTIEETITTVLWADKCDCCGLVFKMEKFSESDQNLGVLRGTFNKVGKRGGNMFFATVCSFGCADKIMKGEWEKMKQYKDFKTVKAKLTRCELMLTSLLLSEQEIIEQWEKGLKTNHYHNEQRY